MIDSVKSVLNPKTYIKNMYLFGILSLFLTMYGPRLHPKLPDGLRAMFNNRIFRAIVIFLIAYISSSDIQTSMVMSIVFLITMNLFHTSKLLEKFKSEGFVINGTPVASCDTYDSKHINSVRTAYYPLNNEIGDLEEDSMMENEANF